MPVLIVFLKETLIGVSPSRSQAGDALKRLETSRTIAAILSGRLKQSGGAASDSS